MWRASKAWRLPSSPRYHLLRGCSLPSSSLSLLDVARGLRRDDPTRLHFESFLLAQLARVSLVRKRLRKTVLRLRRGWLHTAALLSPPASSRQPRTRILESSACHHRDVYVANTAIADHISSSRATTGGDHRHRSRGESQHCRWPPSPPSTPNSAQQRLSELAMTVKQQHQVCPRPRRNKPRKKQ